MGNKQITIIVGIAALILGIIIGAVSCYFYTDSHKSGFVKGAEKTQNFFTGK